MNLENALNISNEYYLRNDKALIYKKPTPIGVVDVSYKNHKKIIEKAYFKEQSTLDYNGLYRGRYIEFDAKETLNKTAFPLSNIHEHQTNQIRNVIKHGGIIFLVIRMNNINYLLTGEDYIYYIDNNNRKSISYNYIQEKAHIIKEAYQPQLDYLSVVDKIYFKGE
ncbi:MAG: Holliday junction resolvase RecU [Firmicutes bacterium]|nr:Holliday junction resolvase RecU [Bacillota bacterium]